MIEVKKITEEDIFSINRLLESLNLVPYPDLGKILKDDGFITLKAISNGEIIGGLIGRFSLDEGEIYDIFISKKFQRKGVGGKLYGEFEYILLKNGVRKVFLEVRESNLKAISFYKKLGFVEGGRRKNYYKNPSEDALIFFKSL